MNIPELDALIDSIIVDNITGLVNPFKVRQVMHAITSAISQTNLAEVTATAPLNYDNFTNTFSLNRSPSDVWKPVQKKPGNTNNLIDEIGDIFSGWSNDGTLRVQEAEWLGGSLGNSDNFKFLAWVEV